MKSNRLKTSIDSFQKILTEQIGMELSHLRKEKGLSGSDLAKKLKISQQQISRYERGICSINCGMLFSILFYLEISPSAFFESVSLKINEKNPSANSFIHNSECLSDEKDNYHYIFNRQTEIILNSLYSK
ncbi:MULTISPECIES: helix-turn-helix domain-containing protein [Providencia]|uniref:Transcriptional regulator, y4mF family n=1 Tax=Providencia rettgeri TaxID=587 RepID=A0A379FKJ3_PRORE|nr:MULTISPECIES: helix-turn-helix transcriptional regulator [Providencia]QXB06217.1 helix-turn-helix domain-containing protein [Providencia rettgeri]SUC29219.1 transcriptional regulator, y4mF family [Providencia rettgeri]HEM7130791.1 helix-turn-helix transcriptional regulator [Providencia rettgeri]